MSAHSSIKKSKNKMSPKEASQFSDFPDANNEYARTTEKNGINQALSFPNPKQGLNLIPTKSSETVRIDSENKYLSDFENPSQPLNQNMSFERQNERERFPENFNAAAKIDSSLSSSQNIEEILRRNQNASTSVSVTSKNITTASYLNQNTQYITSQPIPSSQKNFSLFNDSNRSEMTGLDELEKKLLELEKATKVPAPLVSQNPFYASTSNQNPLDQIVQSLDLKQIPTTQDKINFNTDEARRKVESAGVRSKEKSPSKEILIEGYSSSVFVDSLNNEQQNERKEIIVQDLNQLEAQFLQNFKSNNNITLSTQQEEAENPKRSSNFDPSCKSFKQVHNMRIQNNRDIQGSSTTGQQINIESGTENESFDKAKVYQQFAESPNKFQENVIGADQSQNDFTSTEETLALNRFINKDGSFPNAKIVAFQTQNIDTDSQYENFKENVQKISKELVNEQISKKDSNNFERNRLSNLNSSLKEGENIQADTEEISQSSTAQFENKNNKSNKHFSSNEVLKSSDSDTRDYLQESNTRKIQSIEDSPKFIQQRAYETSPVSQETKLSAQQKKDPYSYSTRQNNFAKGTETRLSNDYIQQSFENNSTEEHPALAQNSLVGRKLQVTKSLNANDEDYHEKSFEEFDAERIQDAGDEYEYEEEFKSSSQDFRDKRTHKQIKPLLEEQTKKVKKELVPDQESSLGKKKKGLKQEDYERNLNEQTDNFSSHEISSKGNFVTSVQRVSPSKDFLAKTNENISLETSKKGIHYANNTGRPLGANVIQNKNEESPNILSVYSKDEVDVEEFVSKASEHIVRGSNSRALNKKKKVSSSIHEQENQPEDIIHTTEANEVRLSRMSEEQAANFYEQRKHDIQRNIQKISKNRFGKGKKTSKNVNQQPKLGQSNKTPVMTNQITSPVPMSAHKFEEKRSSAAEIKEKSPKIKSLEGHHQTESFSKYPQTPTEAVKKGFLIGQREDIHEQAKKISSSKKQKVKKSHEIVKQQHDEEEANNQNQYGSAIQVARSSILQRMENIEKELTQNTSSGQQRDENLTLKVKDKSRPTDIKIKNAKSPGIITHNEQQKSPFTAKTEVSTATSPQNAGVLTVSNKKYSDNTHTSEVYKERVTSSNKSKTIASRESSVENKKVTPRAEFRSQTESGKKEYLYNKTYNGTEQNPSTIAMNLADQYQQSYLKAKMRNKQEINPYENMENEIEDGIYYRTAINKDGIKVVQDKGRVRSPYDSVERNESAFSPESRKHNTFSNEVPSNSRYYEKRQKSGSNQKEIGEWNIKLEVKNSVKERSPQDQIPSNSRYNEKMLRSQYNEKEELDLNDRRFEAQKSLKEKSSLTEVPANSRYYEKRLRSQDKEKEELELNNKRFEAQKSLKEKLSLTEVPANSRYYEKKLRSRDNEKEVLDLSSRLEAQKPTKEIAVGDQNISKGYDKNVAERNSRAYVNVQKQKQKGNLSLSPQHLKNKLSSLTESSFEERNRIWQIKKYQNLAEKERKKYLQESVTCTFQPSLNRIDDSRTSNPSEFYQKNLEWSERIKTENLTKAERELEEKLKPEPPKSKIKSAPASPFKPFRANKFLADQSLDSLKRQVELTESNANKKLKTYLEYEWDDNRLKEEIKGIEELYDYVKSLIKNRMSKDFLPEPEPIKKPVSRSNSQTLKDTSFTYKHKSPIKKLDSVDNEFNDVPRIQSLRGLINPRIGKSPSMSTEEVAQPFEQPLSATAHVKELLKSTKGGRLEIKDNRYVYVEDKDDLEEA